MSTLGPAAVVNAVAATAAGGGGDGATAVAVRCAGVAITVAAGAEAATAAKAGVVGAGKVVDEEAEVAIERKLLEIGGVGASAVAAAGAQKSCKVSLSAVTALHSTGTATVTLA